EEERMKARVVGPSDGLAGFIGSIGVRFMLEGPEAGNRFALVEHPMSPRALAAPLHKHSREDEYSFVIEGRVGALLGDDVIEGGEGSLIFKLAAPHDGLLRGFINWYDFRRLYPNYIGRQPHYPDRAILKLLEQLCRTFGRIKLR